MIFSIVNLKISIAEEVDWALLVGGNDEEDEAQNHEGDQSEGIKGHENGVPLVGGDDSVLLHVVVSETPGSKKGHVEKQEHAEGHSHRVHHVDYLENGGNYFKRTDDQHAIFNGSAPAELLRSLDQRLSRFVVGILVELITVSALVEMLCL